MVEDDRDLRDALREHFEGLGCRVVVASDGLDALEQLERSVPAPPCLVLADLNMPRLGGVDLARALRTDGDHAATPVITMSGEPRREPPRDAEMHLAKPFRGADLDTNVARLCRGGPARYRGLGLREPVGE